ncbi:streptomycin biosynthesis protein [Actinomadura sp. KC06]|uniref:ParB/RepB/Spo0J family partition protein n=1 Tax=Actinomadura sp. KC06 TaxID=2530369 RepID=UPI00105269F8|nr:ParB/RepB/Spo0J family partition protein [Actinomadura sp. KC06]TDD38199.1 streptomycin biosynthesis protein [Actinomadura sp. KC06]
MNASDRVDRSGESFSGAQETYLVPIDQLRPADTPRLEGEDARHIKRLVEIESALPPILVHRPTMRVIDGMHRLRAAKLKGEDAVRVEFFEGTGEAAFIEAVKSNVRHGLPLSMEERRAAAERIILSRQNMSDRAIAECTGLSAKTVSGIRARLGRRSPEEATRIGKDGRRRPLSAAEGRRQAAEALAAEPDAPLTKIAKVAGVSVGTAHDVRQRLRRGEDPVASRDRRKSRPDGATPDDRDRPAEPVSGLRTVRRTDKNSVQERLRSLRKDPSLRFSESGRELLRWLHLQQQLRAHQSRVVENLPAHLLAVVADLAIQCSEMWRSLARELQERENQLD